MVFRRPSPSKWSKAWLKQSVIDTNSTGLRAKFDQLENLKLSDPKELLNENVISRGAKNIDQASNEEPDVEDGENQENEWEEWVDEEDGFSSISSDLPMSPIMNELQWKKRFKYEKKLPKVQVSKLSKEEQQLYQNPYVDILCSPIRQDFYYNRKLPTAFLLKFQNFVHPESKDAWILPVRLRARDSAKIIPGGARYGVNNKLALDAFKLGKWKKIQGLGLASSGIWRTDMADFVVNQLRRRVVDELSSKVLTKRVMSANKVGGKWRDMNIGCILLWPTEPTPQSPSAGSQNALPGEVEVPLNEGENQSAQSDGTNVEQTIKQEEVTNHSQKLNKVIAEDPTSTLYNEKQVRRIVLVNNRKIPQYDMKVLLGSNLSNHLKTQMKIENSVKRNIILNSPLTNTAQGWLWKLAGYVKQKEEIALEGEPADADSFVTWEKAPHKTGERNDNPAGKLPEI